ncbi:MAG: hypothetical protein J6S71_00515 [Clostridia bacterium]|nr:hypothetical protein [Clostridia bacterium]
MDRIIEVKVCGNHLTKDSNIAGTKGEGNITNLRITFDENWEDCAKSVVFWDAYGQNPVRVVLTNDLIEDISKNTRVYLVPIPQEAMARAGHLTFSIAGSLDNKKQVSITSKLEVKDSPDILDPLDPTPSEWEQVQAEIEAIKEGLIDLETARGESEKNATSAKESADKAADAVGKTSYIGENGHWYAWDGVKGEFYDTGIKAQAGSMVYMGENPPDNADVWITDEGMLYIRQESGEFAPLPKLIGKDGKSAYDLAVESGYEGTIEQFTTLLNNLTCSIEGGHLSDTSNPHNVTVDQIGAIPAAYHFSSDLNIELQQGGGKMTVCYYTSATLNTPKTEGVTDYAHGMVITNAYNEQYGTQLCMPSGGTNVFFRGYNKTGISKWMKVSPEDIKTLQEGLAKALLKGGDTMTGPLVIDKDTAWGQVVMRTPSDYYRAFETDDDKVRIEVRDEQLATKRRSLEIYTNRAERRFSHAAMMIQESDGVSKGAYMLHTENVNDFVVSGGAYDGDGTKPKTIPIRKTTQAVMIYRYDSVNQYQISCTLYRGASESCCEFKKDGTSIRLYEVTASWTDSTVTFEEITSSVTGGYLNSMSVNTDSTYNYVVIG